MSTYVGPLGGLQEVECLSGLSVSPARKRVWSEDITGAPVVTVFPGSYRVWSCDIGAAHPSELQALQDLVASQGQPWWLVTCNAETTNLLTPAASRWVGWDVVWGDPSPAPAIYQSGRVQVSDQGDESSAPLSSTMEYTGDEWVYQSPAVPVIPGRWVTVSAFLSANGQIRPAWVDGNGEVLSTGSVAAVGSGSMRLLRAASTSLPPVNAAGVRLQIRRASQAAMPAITWSDDRLPPTEGAGCASAVLGDVAETVINANPTIALSSYRFEVREVRP